MKRLILFLIMLCLFLTGCVRQDGGEAAASGKVVQTPGQSGKTDTPAVVSEPAPVIKTSALGEGLAAESVSLQAPDESFIQGQLDFSLKLFQQAAEESTGENVLVSPLSVASALAMTANGAAGKTAEEMLAVLGGDSMETLNSYLGHYLKNLPTEEKASFDLANSIWFRSGLAVKDDFLQTNVNYYDAEVYEAAFDAATVRDINQWVKEKTDGMIQEMVDELSADSAMHLINAVAFDGEWAEAYKESKIGSGTFYALDDTRQTAKMMISEEDYWLENDKATGFIKDYAGGSYRFAALLPDWGVDLYDYIQGLTAEELLNTLQGVEKTAVDAAMPQFSYEYEIELSDALIEMGMPSAFGAADFSKMADEPLSIDRVQHKTFIEVTESGTRAGASTDVSMKYGMESSSKTVTLDRSFVYFILDAENNLPIFMGVVTSI